MNITQKGILTLIKSAVTQQACALPQGFDLQEAMPWIIRHHITPVAFEGGMRCGLLPNTPAMQTLFQSYCKSLQVSEGQLQELERICQAFDQAGLDYMPLKGCNMKGRYPKAELRMMGDADILIRLEQYERIIPVMKSLGFRFNKESNHELVWQSPKLYVELHKVMIPTYNPDFHGYFGNGWQLAKPAQGNRFAMSPEDEFVYIFTHFAKHYRDGGIGCRHVTDLWVFLRWAADLDLAQVEQKLKKLCLLEFYQNMRRLIAVWFEDAPGDDKTEFITQFIFGSGSYGEEAVKVTSRAVRDTRHVPKGVGGRMVYLWQTAFPSVMVLEEKYTILKKAPWMLPVVWVIRPFYKVLFERESLQKQKRNLQAVTPENLRNRQTALDYVGLDYFLDEGSEMLGQDAP